MNLFEKACAALTDYAQKNPRSASVPKSRQEVIDIYHKAFPELNGGNCSPSDICWNRANGNQMTKDFQNWPHALEYIDGEYKILGSNAKYTGKVYWRHKGDSVDSVFGVFEEGYFHEGKKEVDSRFIGESLPDNVRVRRNNIVEGLKEELKGIPAEIIENERNVIIKFQDLLISGVNIEENVYKIFNVSEEWKAITSYRCNEDEEGKRYYFVDSVDEAISETKRLFLFEAQKGTKKVAETDYQIGTLRQKVTFEKFQIAFGEFLIQADKNAASKKAMGPRYPYGLEYKIIDGGNLSQHFGQGAASKTPYLNWHVVSIYYIVDSQRIAIGIEEDRYPKIKKMKPMRMEDFGNRKTRMAIFYDGLKNSINYKELYDAFIAVSEEVMKLGF